MSAKVNEQLKSLTGAAKTTRNTIPPRFQSIPETLVRRVTVYLGPLLFPLGNGALNTGEQNSICHAWSTVLEFPGVRLTDGQILTLLQNGFREMLAQCQETVVDNKPLQERMYPRAMSALIGPNRQVVVLSSSMKKLYGKCSAIDYSRTSI